MGNEPRAFLERRLTATAAARNDWDVQMSVEIMIRRILKAARELGGSSTPAAFVKSADVIRRVLEDQGLLDSAAEKFLRDDFEENEQSKLVYDGIVRLVIGGHNQLPFLEGSGNFGGIYGHPDHPPAHPRYTTCRITPRGCEYLDSIE